MSVIVSLIILGVAFPRQAWKQRKRNEVVGYIFVSFFGLLLAVLMELGLFPAMSSRFFHLLRWIADSWGVFL